MKQKRKKPIVYKGRKSLLRNIRIISTKKGLRYYDYRSKKAISLDTYLSRVERSKNRRKKTKRFSSKHKYGYDYNISSIDEVMPIVSKRRDKSMNAFLKMVFLMRSRQSKFASEWTRAAYTKYSRVDQNKDYDNSYLVMEYFGQMAVLDEEVEEGKIDSYELINLSLHFRKQRKGHPIKKWNI